MKIPLKVTSKYSYVQSTNLRTKKSTNCRYSGCKNRTEHSRLIKSSSRLKCKGNGFLFYKNIKENERYSSLPVERTDKI